MNNSGLHSPSRTKLNSSGYGKAFLNESPNHQKIMEISEKFKRMTNNEDVERKKQVSIVESNLGVLEKEVGNNALYETKFRVYRDDINNLQERQNEERSQREEVEDKFVKDLKNCEENVRQIIESDRFTRREYESKMIKNLEDKAFNLNVSHARVVKGVEDEFNHRTDEVRNFLGDLKEGIEAETVQREEGIILLTEQIEREVMKVSQNLQIENKIRDEACKKLINMIDEIHNKLRTQMSTERRDRNENSDSILKLLEETCNKLDRRVHKF